ncbi:hypothetical protein [Pelagicoccus albus]|uniref:Uncharacterized protein n=1 Tax=Pelagicoccus albus TaxID=415222 RepID=A0A7X1B756_9BACT|nr:hypothetical protein [Pelagicoccus albus]MBC2606923.1 hypothetical protein [Pelagicoccus albus]
MLTSNRILSVFLLSATLAELGAASLELGHIRARSRGWVEDEAGLSQESETVDVAASEEALDDDSYLSESDNDYDYGGDESDYSDETSPVELEPFKVGSAQKETGPGLGERIMKSVNGLILIGKREKAPSLRNGYLTMDAPPALRFSDLDPEKEQQISPALPEFNMISSEYLPYLVETALPEDAMNDPAMLSEIIIELEPHKIVSGKIDASRFQKEELVEQFDIEEQRSTVLRPEEVLIYFETDSNTGSAGAVVPFSPATPAQNTTIKSSATLKKK